MLDSESRPLGQKVVDLRAREPDAFGRRHDASEVLLQEQPHAHVARRVAHDEGGALWRGLHAVAPRENEVRDQQSVAALAAEARLERHEDPGRGAVARDALAEHQLDTRDHAPPEAKMLGEGPLGQGGLQPQPQRAVVLVPEPRGTVGGLEADKG